VQALVDAVLVLVLLYVVVAFWAVAAEVGYATVPVNLVLIGTVYAAWHLVFTFT